MAVVGDTPELGKWRDYTKCMLQWTVGHYWETAEPIKTSSPIFCYKYVIIEDGKVKRWERGVNRIADLTILPEREDDLDESLGRISACPSLSSMAGAPAVKLQRRRSSSPDKIQVRHVQIEDEWEHFNIKFSVNDASDDLPNASGGYMAMIGSSVDDKTNETSSTPPMRMQRAARPIKWLYEKYGQVMRPWELVMTFRMDELDLPKEINYSYARCSEDGRVLVSEQLPTRSMLIQKAESYANQLNFKNSQW